MRKALCVLGVLVASAVPCLADGAVTIDYAAAAQTVSTSVTPIVATVLPIAVGIFALLFGPRILLKLIKSFSRA